jgi:hypothetical protein
MRTAIALLLALSFALAVDRPAQAEPAACKQCRDQQRACMSNYPGKTCKTEYDICMKGCKSK